MKRLLFAAGVVLLFVYLEGRRARRSGRAESARDRGGRDRVAPETAGAGGGGDDGATWYVPQLPEPEDRRRGLRLVWSRARA